MESNLLAQMIVSEKRLRYLMMKKVEALARTLRLRVPSGRIFDDYAGWDSGGCRRFIKTKTFLTGKKI